MTRPRPRPAGARGRGRPPLFDDHAKAMYLKHVADGMLLDAAAAAVGVARRTVNWHATHDKTFREDRDRAKETGRAARWEDKPHDEYRYIHGGCRCTACTAAASAARTARRHTAEAETTPSHEPVGHFPRRGGRDHTPTPAIAA